jgi:hypothetical protein
MGADFPGRPAIGVAGCPAATFAGAAARPEGVREGARLAATAGDFRGDFRVDFVAAARLREEADFFPTVFCALRLVDLALFRADVFRAMKEPPCFQDTAARPGGGIVRV